MGEEFIKQKLDYWKRKLIDLSKRNNLISYKYTKSRSVMLDSDFYKIVEDLSNRDSVRLLKKEEEEKEGYWKINGSDSEVSNKMSKIFQKEKENFQELGINSFFLGIGMLEYQEADSNDDVRAPILLFPVELKKLGFIPKDSFRYELYPGSEIKVNQALAEKLNQEQEIKLEDINGKDIEEYLKYVESVVEGSGWNVKREICLDIFSYQKSIMFEDISDNEEKIKNNNLIKTFTGEESEEPSEDNEEGMEILPADSSQMKAINLSKKGKSFVMEGPPGTGKSQTIANIISSLIKDNKKVLFVSQKRAALDVVKKRLDQIGIGRYCLNLHAFRGNKKEVINQFAKELNNVPKIPSVNFSEIDNYLGIHKEINEYYDFLCKNLSEKNISLYDIRGKVASLSGTPLLDKELTSVLEGDESNFSYVKSIMERIEKLFSDIGDPFDNDLFKFKSSKSSTLELNRFKEVKDKLIRELEEIKEFSKEVYDNTGYEISDFDTLQRFLEVLNTSLEGISDFLLSENLPDYKEKIDNLYELVKEREDLKSSLFKKVDESFLSLDTKRARQVMEEKKFMGGVFDSDLKAMKKKLAPYSKEKLTRIEWLELMDEKDKLNEVNDKIKNFEDGLEDDLNKLEKLKNEVKKVEEILKKIEEVDEERKFDILKFIKEREEKRDYLNETKEIFDELNSYFEKEIFQAFGEFDNLLERVKHLNTDYLNDILTFKEEYRKLESDIRGFIDSYCKEFRDYGLLNIFLKSYYMQLLDKILSQEKKLSPKALVNSFRDSDFQIRDYERYSVIDNVKRNQPQDVYKSYGSNEVSILKREHQKKRKLKPIRELLENIPNIAFSLKPCFMMSPLSVSQYLKDQTFDTVIFDEASQLMPEDSIPCLLRAKQAIIMGDTQQLPPTNFFLGEGIESEEDIEDLDSFLSEASTKFRCESLKWHYRSMNENLIAFSNNNIYDGKLVTFPHRGVDDGSGVEMKYVEGVYDRGKSRKNEIEAKEIVEKYKNLKKEYPSKSIGIIAFSVAQEEAIREKFEEEEVEVDEMIQSSEEKTFIKNLETVQGDERDIILLSVGYGRDSEGRVPSNFGPLNRDGGYKRLNVAITRGRFKTIVVSSLKSKEINSNKTNSKGVKLLKDYLEYAEKGGAFEKEEFNKRDDLVEDIANELSNEGFDVEKNIGKSEFSVDVGIRNPDTNEFFMAIDCDGSGYEVTRDARDKDKIRRSMLESMGWYVYRVWSEDWVNSKNKVMDNIKEKFEKIKSIGGLSGGSLSTGFDKIEESERSKDVMENKNENYTPHHPESEGMEDRIIEVVKNESPIEKDLLFKRVKGEREDFDECLESLKDKKISVNLKSVWWGEPQILSTVRLSKPEERPFELIPKEEIGQAIFEVLNEAYSIDKEALFKDVPKKFFGVKRMNDKVKDKMNEALSHLIENEIADYKEGKVFLQ